MAHGGMEGGNRMFSLCDFVMETVKDMVSGEPDDKVRQHEQPLAVEAEQEVR